MKEFEELMDRRPFLVNDVLLRRNPNDVQEWEKRVAMWGNDDEKVGIWVVTAYVSDLVSRLQKRIPKLYQPLTQERRRQISTGCTSTLPKFYEEGGVGVKLKMISIVLVKY